jgi:hypothetical protein
MSTVTIVVSLLSSPLEASISWIVRSRIEAGKQLVEIGGLHAGQNDGDVRSGEGRQKREARGPHPANGAEPNQTVRRELASKAPSSMKRT